MIHYVIIDGQDGPDVFRRHMSPETRYSPASNWPQVLQIQINASQQLQSQGRNEILLV